MVQATAIDADTFEAAWAEHRGRRYGYGWNGALFALYAVLMLAFWGYWTVELLAKGFAMDLAIVGGVFLGLTLFILVSTAYWNFVRRTSGVVCAPDRLLWRYGRDIYAVPWDDLTIDRLGLSEVRGQNDSWVLHVLGRPLPLFGPHVKLKNLELFLAMALMSLEDSGPKSAGTENTQ